MIFNRCSGVGSTWFVATEGAILMRNNMTTKQVIHTLHLHQKWRRGAISQPLATQKEYGEALDEALRLLRKMSKQEERTWKKENIK